MPGATGQQADLDAVVEELGESDDDEGAEHRSGHRRQATDDHDRDDPQATRWPGSHLVRRP